MINACVTNYNKDTSKDNSLSLVKHVCVCALCLATVKKNRTILQNLRQKQILQIISIL